MLFTLQNLGRLEEATIDLGKDLIVLTGPNNTSKTYVAHAIYGFCRLEGHALDDLVKQHAERLALRGDTATADRLEIDLMPLLRDHLDFLLESVSQMYTAQLGSVFAASTRQTSRAKVTISISAEERAVAERHFLELADRTQYADDRIIMEKLPGRGELTVTRMPRSPTNGDNGSQTSALRLSEVGDFYAALLLDHVLFGAFKRAHIFAAERSAIEVFSRELAAQRFDPLAKNMPLSYPLALADGLKTAQQTMSAQKSTSTYAAEADRLDGEILGGKIEIGAYGEMLFVPEGTTERLDMNLSSSSVKALASLSIYLRHLARKGDFLIIDEPELNLHPRNQRLVTRLLARLSRSGIKVMMSTHSDYILRELNNMLMLSRDPDGQLSKKHRYSVDETLTPERVGGYAFDGAHGRPIEIRPGGMDVEAIDAEIHELNSSSRDIYFTLDDMDEP